MSEVEPAACSWIVGLFGSDVHVHEMSLGSGGSSHAHCGAGVNRYSRPLGNVTVTLADCDGCKQKYGKNESSGVSSCTCQYAPIWPAFSTRTSRMLRFQPYPKSPTV